ncbi:2-pyrone-4,6-dicarboxylate hydrolase [Brenneria roseae subsp. americana]|uniref:2-pyrone-4,6-dicarboxylate hydrolase n=1 Tax=Brenneria roseae subsp. americana TaxID=1508507 RepID=A0A2U1TRB5_9GAMM|nr:amidohydrolase family protein [Brenneria roseae]PWC11950.1 2-pyrone-4,6-dicarboxylate hydrolase [Brenneria roseae subsp. americana]
MKTCKAPDPHPVKPKAALPIGACDAHCHVFGPGHTFPYGANRKYTPEDAPFEKLMELHNWLGITRAVIVQASCHGTDNRAMLDAIARSQGRYLGVAMIDGSESDEELERLDQGGVRGIRFNFVQHLGGAPELPRFFSILDRVESFGWHVVLHLDAQDILTYDAVLQKIRLPFIIDHMGRVKTERGLEQEAFTQLRGLLADNPLAWVKVSGSERISAGKRPFNDAIPFAQALIDTAPDRVLWGTDWPHPNISNDMPNDGELVDLMLDFCPDTALRQKLLVDNPARLYGFPEIHE